jgi:hypothetical protein
MPKVLHNHNGVPVTAHPEGKVFKKRRWGPRRSRVPVRPVLAAEINFFGRHRNGMIRDGAVPAVTPLT